MNMKHKDFKKFFTTHGYIKCFQSNSLMKGSLGKSDMFLTNKEGLFNIFIRKDKEIICGKEGYRVFSDENEYQKFLKEFKNYIEKVKTTIYPKYKSIPESLTKEEFTNDIKLIGKFWHYYGYTEFPHIDYAYDKLKETGNKVLEKNLHEFSKFKFEAREMLNAFFFKNGIIDNLVGYITENFYDGTDASFLRPNELIAAFDGEKVDEETLKQRKKCYSAAIIDGEITWFNYKDSLELNKEFTKVFKTDFIKGITASPGKAKGRAIISPMLDSHEAIAKINAQMKKGDVLIAETTSPDTLMLYEKASAIVAEQSGLLSHAAVVSREMKIPCIIQAEGATRIFKTGDIVEVDADKGVVRKVYK